MQISTELAAAAAAAGVLSGGSEPPLKGTAVRPGARCRISLSHCPPSAFGTTTRVSGRRATPLPSSFQPAGGRLERKSARSSIVFPIPISSARMPPRWRGRDTALAVVLSCALPRAAAFTSSAMCFPLSVNSFGVGSAVTASEPSGVSKRSSMPNFEFSRASIHPTVSTWYSPRLTLRPSGGGGGRAAVPSVSSALS